MKMKAPKKSKDIPIFTFEKLSELPKANGFLFGFPTRFGIMPAQMKAFFDETGSFWFRGDLYGKPAGLFTSTATIGGGQETTIFTAVTQLAHHGMVFVPLGYSFGQELYNLSEVRGGSPWGAGTYSAEDGSRFPSDLEKRIAHHQGEQFAKYVNKML
jgi:NAD(P)H dehydrogenase (quinone)